MLGLTAIQARYTGFSPKSSEEFSSASRSVKPGLIASGIVSAWTWAATLVGNLIQHLLKHNTYLYNTFIAPVLSGRL
jgi:Na+/proline symporter